MSIDAVSSSQTGTSTVDETPVAQGVHVFREPKDLYGYGRQRAWLPAQAPIDESEAVDDINALPLAESSILFGISRDPRIQIVRPIPVEIRHQDDIVIASWNEADEYGRGRNRSDALEDFSRTVTQLFVSLSRDEEMLGADMHNLLGLLRRHFTFRI